MPDPEKLATFEPWDTPSIRARKLGWPGPFTNGEYGFISDIVLPTPPPVGHYEAKAVEAWADRIADVRERVDLALLAWTGAQQTYHDAVAAQRAAEVAADRNRPRMDRTGNVVV